MFAEALTEFIKKQTSTIKEFIAEPKGVFEFIDELIKNRRMFIRSMLEGFRTPTSYKSTTTRHKILRE